MQSGVSPLAQMCTYKVGCLTPFCQKSGGATTMIVVFGRGLGLHVGTISRLRCTLGCAPRDSTWPRETFCDVRNQLGITPHHTLTWLVCAGICTHVSGQTQIHPAYLLVGTSCEKFCLQAQAMLNIRSAWISECQHGSVVRNRHFEQFAVSEEGPRGIELIIRCAQWAARYTILTVANETTDNKSLTTRQKSSNVSSAPRVTAKE